MSDLFAPLSFTRGPAMKNRLMLAPLTNQQSNPDGTLSDAERHWLAMRAKGGFGLVMTAAAYVQTIGKGFAGQLGIHDDICLDGLKLMAAALKAEGALAHVQLHHAGLRSEAAVTGLQPVAPSADEAIGARAMTLGEIEEMIEAFVRGAERAEQAGFDGVELHGAHTYLLCEFLSSDFNRREDLYGGSLENRGRVIREVIAGIRQRTGRDFQLGLRLSAESMGMKLGEVREFTRQLCAEGQLDYIDLSLWDVFKTPEEADFKGRPLVDWFTDFDRNGTRIGVAGQIRSGAAARRCLEAGADFPIIGRAAIINHDFVEKLRGEPDYTMPALPVPRDRLPGEGVSPAFLTYLETSFPGFVAA